MRINTNVGALNALRNLTLNTTRTEKAMQRLSSGYRINSAADDAAGQAVSEKMKAQIKGIGQAIRNAQDGISMLQTAEGGLKQVTDMVGRIRELAVQAASDTLVDNDRLKLQKEVDALLEEITRTADAAKFNGKDTIGTSAATVSIQVGPNSGDKIDLAFTAVDADTLGLTGLSIGTQADAAAAITTLDTAIGTLTDKAADFGSLMNRLDYATNTLTIQKENLSAANSRIVDADMAEEMTNFTKFNVLNQVATSMLAQANQQSQNVLSLLR